MPAVSAFTNPFASQGMPGTAPITKPPAEVLEDLPSYYVVGDPDALHGRVSFDLDDRKVHFDWTFSVNGEVRAAKQQAVDVSYWPTRLSRFDEQHLLVAGKTLRGKTIVELWHFELATVQTAVQEPGGGLVYTILPAAITSVDPVYLDQVEGRDTVIGMQRAMGPDKGVLLYFWDSKSIYHLDLTEHFTGEFEPEFPLTLRAVATGPSSVPVDPNLAYEHYDRFYAVHHATLGHVYVLAPSTTSQDHLLLIDGDRNGTINATLLASYADWQALGLADPAQIVDPEL